MTNPTPPPTRRYTAAVRRGLALVASLARASTDDRQPPGSRIVLSWTLTQQREYDRALEWIDQETPREP